MMTLTKHQLWAMQAHSYVEIRRIDNDGTAWFTDQMGRLWRTVPNGVTKPATPTQQLSA